MTAINRILFLICAIGWFVTVRFYILYVFVPQVFGVKEVKDPFIWYWSWLAAAPVTMLSIAIPWFVIGWLIWGSK